MNELVRKHGFIGYAEVYLWRCNEESELDEIIDFDIYKKLAEIDTNLDMTASEQLFRCLLNTSRLDIIEVRFKLCYQKDFQNNFRLSILSKSKNMIVCETRVGSDLAMFT